MPPEELPAPDRSAGPDHLTHGGRIHDDPDPFSVLDFSSNINPYGPPRRALAAARRALALARFYPDPEMGNLRRALGKWLSVPFESVVPGNGASDLIGAVLSTLPVRRLVVPSPTFSEYAAAAGRRGVPVERILSGEEEGFAYPLEETLRRMAPGDLVTVCRPNNPTGSALPLKGLEALRLRAEEVGALVLADECFAELSDPPAGTLAGNPMRGSLVVVRALTKDFSAPGLRLGFALAEPRIAGAIREGLQPWPISCVAEAFGVACAEEPEPFLSRSRIRLSRARAEMIRELSELGFRVLPSAANFLSAKAPLSGEELAMRLAPLRILIRRCANFGMDDRWVRLAVKDPGTNRRLLDALRGVITASGRGAPV